MFPIKPSEIETLKAGRIPESIDPQLFVDIKYTLTCYGEVTIAFYPSDDCTYASVIEDENDVFNDWGEEEGRLTLRRCNGDLLIV